MRRARVDLFQHFGCRCIILENRQRRDIWLLSCERLKLGLLSRSFLLRPDSCRITGDCFNATSSRCDGFFSDDPKRSDLAGKPDVR